MGRRYGRPTTSTALGLEAGEVASSGGEVAGGDSSRCLRRRCNHRPRCQFWPTNHRSWWFSSRCTSRAREAPTSRSRTCRRTSHSGSSTCSQPSRPAGRRHRRRALSPPTTTSTAKKSLIEHPPPVCPTGRRQQGHYRLGTGSVYPPESRRELASPARSSAAASPSARSSESAASVRCAFSSETSFPRRGSG